MASICEQVLYHDSLERHYLLYVPDIYQPSAPLLLVLHGSGIDADVMIKMTGGGFEALADQEGFVVAYPNAVDELWNDGRRLPDKHSDADDVGFIRALIERLVSEYSLDRRRIYVTGLSNGGGMAYRLARELSDQIAAIAPVAAVMRESFALAGVQKRPVAVLIIAGTADPVSPYKGGKARLIWRLLILHSKGVRFLSAAATARFWAEANHCAGDPITTPLPIANSSDRTRVRQTVYSGGAAPVVLYTVEGGGHTWPGGWQYMPAFFIGKASRQLDACQVIWDFFAGLMS